MWAQWPSKEIQSQNCCNKFHSRCEAYILFVFLKTLRRLISQHTTWRGVLPGENLPTTCYCLFIGFVTQCSPPRWSRRVWTWIWSLKVVSLLNTLCTCLFIKLNKCVHYCSSNIFLSLIRNHAKENFKM